MSKINTNVQILDDEELLEVTGGLVQLVNPGSCAHRSKEECHDFGGCKCDWNDRNKTCSGGCM